MITGKTFVTFCFVLFSTSLWAQADTLFLEEVSVSVIPFQEDIEAATGGLYSISVPELGLQQVLNNSEILNLAPGVFMANGTYNTNRLVIRGIGSRTPYGSNRIRAYLDNIPLTSGDGVSSVEDIDAFSISSIDIVKGPSSALYGSGLGGIVKMSSKYPKAKGFSFYQSNDFGSYNTFKNTISVAYKEGQVALMAGYSRSFTDGYRENSEFRRNNIFLNAQYVGKRSVVSVSMYFIDLFSQIPSSLNYEDFTSSPQKASGNWLAAGGFEEYLKAMAGVSIESSLAEGLQNDFVLYSKFGDPYERRPFNVLDEQSFSFGFRESITYKLDKVNVAVGFEYYRDNFDWQTYETLDEGQGAKLADNREKRQYVNGFTYIQWRPIQKFIVDAGLNTNLLTYNLETVYDPDGADHSGKYSYKPVLSPRLGVNYEYIPFHFLYSSIGHGFSAPSLEETLLPEGSVNLALKPETGWNMEIGERGVLFSGRLRYDLTGYAVYLQNLLVTERIAEDVFTGVNAGTVLNTGIEMMGQYSVFDSRIEKKHNLSVMLGMSFSKNIFLDFIDDGVSYSGKHLPGVPEQIIHASLMAKAGKFNARFQYRFVGSQWMDDGNTLMYDAYNLANFQLAWKHQLKGTSFGIEIFSGVKNIFNTSYASMILVNAPSFGGNAPRYYYPGLPRQFRVGVAISFN